MNAGEREARQMAHEFMHGLEMHKVVTTRTEDAYTFAIHGPKGPVGFELTISGEDLVDLRNSPVGEDVTIGTLEKQAADDYVRYVDEVLKADAEEG
jgi:hypothetical protein